MNVDLCGYEKSLLIYLYIYLSENLVNFFVSYYLKQYLYKKTRKLSDIFLHMYIRKSREIKRSKSRDSFIKL